MIRLARHFSNASTLLAFRGLGSIVGVSLGALAAVTTGCGPDDVVAAAGVSCGSSTTAASTDEARGALASATPGSCVILTGTTYEALRAPAGVTLAAKAGTRPSITSADRAVPAVALGEGSVLAGVAVVGPAGIGILASAANGRVVDVDVTGAGSAALAVVCAAGESACASGTFRVDQVSLAKSAYGLRASGAHVVMTGGRSAEHATTGVSGGFGVLGTDGARLELDGTLVEKNQGAGVLADGAATRLVVRNAMVSENKERGVWTQRMVGSLEAPAVRIEASQVDRNGMVGVGSVEVRGIIIVGGKVANTTLAPITTGIGPAEVGDGIGLFASTDFRLEATQVEGNARAAGLVNEAVTGIIIVGGKVVAGASGLKVVVQGAGGADVQVPSADLSVVASPLAFSAPKLDFPPL